MDSKLLNAINEADKKWYARTEETKWFDYEMLCRTVPTLESSSWECRTSLNVTSTDELRYSIAGMQLKFYTDVDTAFHIGSPTSGPGLLSNTPKESCVYAYKRSVIDVEYWAPISYDAAVDTLYALLVKGHRTRYRWVVQVDPRTLVYLIQQHRNGESFAACLQKESALTEHAQFILRSSRWFSAIEKPRPLAFAVCPDRVAFPLMIPERCITSSELVYFGHISKPVPMHFNAVRYLLRNDKESV